MATSGNLVFQFTNGTGTGNLTLSSETSDSPVQYFRDFATVFGTGTGNKFYYCIRHRAAAEFEVGIGYMFDSTTMVRDSVIESSNSNSAVSFSSGTKDVISDLPASLQNFLTQIAITAGKTLTVPLDSTVSGTNTGDQLTFKTYSVSGQSDVVADTAADTMTLVAGTGMTITTDASTDTITFASSASGGTVTTTGSPASGNLTKFSGASSITNGDLSGDIATSGTLATVLATVNANVGSFGSATQVGTFTVSGKGLVTAAGNTTVTPAVGSITGLGTGVATFLATPSSANLISAVTDETGSGSLVFATSPTFVTPALGTPSSGVATNLTGTASGLTAGTVTTNANLTGAVTSVGNATSLGSFTSAQLATALTDETGSGANVFANSPVLVTPALGTPASGIATNLTGTAAGLTAGTVTTNANLTGDVTSVGNATTLATVNSNVGTFGTATQSSTFTVNGKGLITAASNTAIQIAESQVTNLVTDLASKSSLGVTYAFISGSVIF